MWSNGYPASRSCFLGSIRSEDELTIWRVASVSTPQKAAHGCPRSLAFGDRGFNASARQRFYHCLRMPRNHCQISPRRAIWTPPSLLPILQSPRIECKPSRKLRAAEAGGRPHRTHIHFQRKRNLVNGGGLRLALGNRGRLAHGRNKFICNILPLYGLILRTFAAAFNVAPNALVSTIVNMGMRTRGLCGIAAYGSSTHTARAASLCGKFYGILFSYLVNFMVLLTN